MTNMDNIQYHYMHINMTFIDHAWNHMCNQASKYR